VTQRVQLSLDFEEVSHDGEEGGEGERRREQADEAKLDNSLIVEEHESVSLLLHAELFFDRLMKSQLLLLLKVALFIDFRLENFSNLLDFHAINDAVLGILDQVETNLLEGQDGDQVIGQKFGLSRPEG